MKERRTNSLMASHLVQMEIFVIARARVWNDQKASDPYQVFAPDSWQLCEINDFIRHLIS